MWLGLETAVAVRGAWPLKAGRTVVLGYLIGGGVGLALLLWYGAAMVWAASVSTHQPELHESVQGARYGWKCPRCGRTQAPACKVKRCGGPLVWVQRGSRIKCARCHRQLVAHPMLFRRTPRPRRMWCSRCRRLVVVRDWKIG